MMQITSPEALPMEEIVPIAIQVVIELAIQIFGSPSLSWASGNNKVDRGCSYMFLHLFAGAAIGWVSIMVAPHYVLPYAWLRAANLIVTPLVSGTVSYWIAKSANKKGSKWDPQSHFAHGALFALMFGLVRFAFGER